jgi:hypothetical protein
LNPRQILEEFAISPVDGTDNTDIPVTFSVYYDIHIYLICPKMTDSNTLLKAFDTSDSAVVAAEPDVQVCSQFFPTVQKQS